MPALVIAIAVSVGQILDYLAVIFSDSDELLVRTWGKG